MFYGRCSLDAVLQDGEGHQLQQGVHRHYQVWVIVVKYSRDMPPRCDSCHLEEGHMHETWLLSIVAKSPQKPILDQETVRLWYLVHWPRGMLTPDVNDIQLQHPAVVIEGVAHLHMITAVSFGIRYKDGVEHVLVCCKVTYLILVAIQNLEPTSDSLSACSVPAASVRH